MTTRTASLPNFDTLATLAALGFGAYLVYNLVQGIGKVGAGAAAAGAAVSQTLVPKPTGTASIVLGDGTEIPYESVTFDPWWSHWSGSYFTFSGKHYRFVNDNPDETNTYYAVQVS
jgi:hypothetical protein